MIVQGISGQNYIPIPMDSTIWRVDFHGHDDATHCNCFMPYQFLTDGDTVINFVIYTKIKRSGNFNCVNCPYYFSNGYKGAIRQDTITRKVFIVEPNNINEKILYDFSLTVGDTVNSILVDQGCGPQLIVAVDSILLNSTYHKRLILGANGCNPFGGSFIEGIGSKQGFLDKMYSFEWGSVLICVTHSNKNIYFNQQSTYTDTITGCSMIFQNINENKKNRIFIAPNPFGDFFEINLMEQTEKVYLTLYDLYSRKLYTKISEQVKTFKVQRDNLPSGVYIYQLRSDKQIISTGKIIAE